MLLAAKSYDIVLSDYNLPQWTGMDVLKLLQQAKLDIPFILVTGTLGEEAAVECIKMGVTDYVLKDRLARLPVAVQRALDEKALRDNRVASEDALRQSEARLQLQIERMPIGLIVWSPDFRVVSWNPAAEQIFGFTADEAIGKHPYGLIVPKSAQPNVDAIYRRLLEGDFTAHSINENVTKDGRIIICQWSNTPLKETDGSRVMSVHSMVQDITERKQAEEDLRQAHGTLEVRVEERTTELAKANEQLEVELSERKRAEEEIQILNQDLEQRVVGRTGELRASEERFRELFENANDIVYTLDLAGRFTSLNKAGERATGYTRAEALTMRIKQIVAPEDLPRVRQMMKQRNVGRGGSPTYDFNIVARDGRPLVLEVSARPIVQDGKPVGMQGIARDVTERKQLEAQFRQAQKMEAVGRLAGGVAHDFNNLLMVVRGYSEMSLARLGPHESLRSNLEEIQKAADRAASLTQQILAFSRQQVFQPKVLDLNTVVTDAEKMLRRLIGEDIEVVAELAPELGAVKSDPGRIEQIILNLAVNGRDAMPRGGRLTLKTSNVTLDEAFARLHMGARPGPHVLLAVSDTGTGMDAETRSHIFEPFFTTKGPDKGTGLGLSTVYGIVKQSGGYVWVDSAPGRGTTFEIYLPLVEKVAAGGELLPAILSPPRGGTETILVVEDELSVRKLGANFLASSGYTVLEAPDGAAALKVCEKHPGPIHLLMTDLVMPGMSGRELAVRLAGRRPELKVIYVSGYTDDNVVPHEVLEKEIAFLPKPFSLNELAHKVREALESEEEFRPRRVS